MIKQSYQKYLAALVIFAITFLFHFKHINEFPQYKHSWAQSDRYALAIGFVNNGGDFFHPQTYLLNNQFPGEFDIPRNTTITSVDFPIHDYIVSVIMRLFNTTDPWCFRIYIMFYSMIGMFFLYKIATLFTNSFYKQLSVVLFAMSAPVFLYYQNGFLPTTPSLANAFISFYFFFRHIKDNSKRDFIYSILFITLATMSRLPFAIVLVAFICFEGFSFLKKRKFEFYKLMIFFIPVICIGGYYIYNNHLRAEYGSLFLNYLMPASSYNEFKEFTIEIYKRWFYTYFNLWSYLLLVFLVFIFLVNRILKKTQIVSFESKLLFISFIMMTGCIMYFVVMNFQFIFHDYYFLDTFFILFVLLFLFFIIKIPDFSNKTVRLTVEIGLLLFFVPILVISNSTLKSEKEAIKTYNPKSTADNFKDADKFLDSIKIPKDAKILVMGADGPNNPLVLMKRNGFTVIYPDSNKIARALNWPYDYVALENDELYNLIYTPYPEIVNRLERVTGNDGITIFKKRNTNNLTDYNSFFNLAKSKLVYHKRISFDTIPENCSGIDSLTSFSFSGKKAGYVDKDIEYGFTHIIYNPYELTKGRSMLTLTSKFFAKADLKDIMICVSANDGVGNSNIMFSTGDLSGIKIGSWVSKNFIFSIPANENAKEMTVFIWNRGKNTLFFDDLEISLYGQ